MSAFAFFDVDETLIHVKSMFSFLHFWYARHGCPDEYARQMHLIETRAASGASRVEINRDYYRLFAGIPFSALIAVGKDWFEAQLAQDRLFKRAVLDRLQALQAEGVATVLVSGSMRPLLEPIAAQVNARAILCAELSVVDGVATGELDALAIGPHKRDRVLDFLARAGADAAWCYAFGDHITDLAMLGAVAHPSAVDPCPELAAAASSRGWSVLWTARVGV
jgi:HAD superfamily hydrolase (TIGR01490 family)